jgi:hypothetical protein
MIAPRRGDSIGRKPVPAGLAALAKASITCALLAPPSLFDRQAGISERGVPAGIPNTIWKPAVVLLATKYAWLAAARSAVSISSRLVSGFAASASVMLATGDAICECGGLCCRPVGKVAVAF